MGRLRAATKEELNTPIPNMPDEDHEEREEEEEVEETKEVESSGSVPTACRKCDELKAPNAKGSEEVEKESKSEVWILGRFCQASCPLHHSRVCFQECLASSSKPLLARASGKGGQVLRSQ